MEDIVQPVEPDVVFRYTWNDGEPVIRVYGRFFTLPIENREIVLNNLQTFIDNNKVKFTWRDLFNFIKFW